MQKRVRSFATASWTHGLGHIAGVPAPENRSPNDGFQSATDVVNRRRSTTKSLERLRDRCRRNRRRRPLEWQLLTTSTSRTRPEADPGRRSFGCRKADDRLSDKHRKACRTASDAGYCFMTRGGPTRTALTVSLTSTRSAMVTKGRLGLRTLIRRARWRSVLDRERVHPVNVPFTDAVRVVSRWGYGAKDLVAAMQPTEKRPVPLAR